MYLFILWKLCPQKVNETIICFRGDIMVLENEIESLVNDEFRKKITFFLNNQDNSTDSEIESED
jgi:hypothetical protein